MLVLFVKLNRIWIIFALIWDSFVVEFGVFEALLVNSVWMLAFESLSGVFWTTFGGQNGALGLIVGHVGATSVLIWAPKVGKIGKKCRKVSMENVTKEITFKKYTSGPSWMSKSDVSCTRNACFQESYLSWKCHQNRSNMAPKCSQNGPKSTKRPPLERKKTTKDATACQQAANAVSKLWNSLRIERKPRHVGAKKYLNCQSYD